MLSVLLKKEGKELKISCSSWKVENGFLQIEGANEVNGQVGNSGRLYINSSDIFSIAEIES